MTGIAGRIAQTDRGRVRGVTRGEVISFRGIPYAASPVGELRFAPPRPHPGWTGVREAVEAGPAVPQAASRLEQVMGARVPDWNEDGALTVNVHAPSGAFEDNASRPVLVWWHGGGFTSGSGGWDWYDGGRLAALGDIASFGGDPGQVTVGGQSARAYSALSLALDPRTSGLMTRVLLQSGPFGLAPQDPRNATENAETYLRLLGVESGADRAKTLRTLPVEQLLSAYGRLAGQLARPGSAAPPMYPVLGGPGVPRAWQRTLADGALDGKALLIGTTRDEATAFTAFDPRVQNLTSAGALDLLTGQLGERAHEVYQRYAARLERPTPARVFTAVQTDELFRDDSLRIADHHATGGNATYVYRFDYRPAEDGHALGATHCGELPFLFNTFDAYPDSPMLGRPTDAGRALGRAFATSVAEFVTTGSVTDWPPYAPATADRIRHFG
ncbi:carboxylesterase family protein [Streptomyces sp. NPDC005962]|uniref:carboxylesterase family protein n=1 Tax=Streptomyces sp. NPDC005962 TaxID=3154466 RepID=UPI003402708A